MSCVRHFSRHFLNFLVYLAKSMDQLELMLKSNATPTFIPQNLSDCYLRAHVAWVDDDIELAFLLYNRVTEKLYENSIFNDAKIGEALERIATLAKCLKNRYKTIQSKKIFSIDNTINELNTVRFEKSSPKCDGYLIESFFSKYAMMKKICFNVHDERGFGFVRFALSTASDANSKENGTMYYGQRITFKRFVEKLNTLKESVSTQSNRAFSLKLMLHNVLTDYETEDELRSLFSRFGEIKKMIIFSCSEKEKNGFVVVEFKYAFSTVNAYVKMRQFEMPSGHTMHISLSTTDEVRQELMRRFTKIFCFECNDDREQL
ncbi:hypothetical protein B4U80_13340 [Leptotrombidium deliense]|uniref:RRM domain-containing protein n=1 Tax=Leptotrombidium deliense TaxID=299467 RepID=A0A443S7Y6_9ACAR|nr:hypothetical protein B4U80_13340 [Leptotrombidium deliense]